MEDEEPRLVLLDLMLPGTDGIIVMKSIQDVADVPIIFLSAYGQDQVIARAFEMGAADYVVKPFSPTELVARIHAALRRPPAAPRRPSHDFWQPGREPYEFGEMVIDFERRTTTLGGLRLKLTPTEYRVLAELAANASRVLTHGELLRRIWRNNRTGDSGPVRTIIKRLRRSMTTRQPRPTSTLSPVSGTSCRHRLTATVSNGCDARIFGNGRSSFPDVGSIRQQRVRLYRRSVDEQQDSFPLKLP